MNEFASPRSIEARSEERPAPSATMLLKIASAVPKSEQHEHGVVCPECGSHQTFVSDSRPAHGRVRRRRWCMAGHRFTTYEEVRNATEVLALDWFTKLSSKDRAIVQLIARRLAGEAD